MMYKIQTLNNISDVIHQSLTAERYLIAKEEPVPDGILVRSASMHDMDLPDSLLAIARAGAGTNNIPIDRCSEAGIAVFNTPGANANAVAELVICGLMLGSRNVAGGIDWARTLDGQGAEVAKLVEKGKSQFAGPEIKGKTLGIIGLGAIGALVANAAVALGMKVVGTDPFLSIGAALRLDPSVTVVKTQDDVFAVADYLTIHVPFNKDTEGMINAASIAKMKDGVTIINCARGELMNIPDMIRGIETQKIGALALDVFDKEDGIYHENRRDDIISNRDMAYLRQFPNVIMTQHMAFYTDAAVQSMVFCGIEGLCDFAKTGHTETELV